MPKKEKSAAKDGVDLTYGELKKYKAWYGKTLDEQSFTLGFVAGVARASQSHFLY